MSQESLSTDPLLPSPGSESGVSVSSGQAPIIPPPKLYTDHALPLNPASLTSSKLVRPSASNTAASFAASAAPAPSAQTRSSATERQRTARACATCPEARPGCDPSRRRSRPRRAAAWQSRTRAHPPRATSCRPGRCLLTPPSACRPAR